MKTRTKLLSLLLCAAMLLPLFACSGSQSAGTPAPRIPPPPLRPLRPPLPAPLRAIPIASSP